MAMLVCWSCSMIVCLCVSCMSFVCLLQPASCEHQSNCHGALVSWWDAVEPDCVLFFQQVSNFQKVNQTGINDVSTQSHTNSQKSQKALILAGPKFSKCSQTVLKHSHAVVKMFSKQYQTGLKSFKKVVQTVLFKPSQTRSHTVLITCSTVLTCSTSAQPVLDTFSTRSQHVLKHSVHNSQRGSSISQTVLRQISTRSQTAFATQSQTC